MMMTCDSRPPFERATQRPLRGMLVVCAVLSAIACASQDTSKNALYQQTGEEGSRTPKAHAPYYPNTAGNIVAPPGNPGGNPAGSPPLVGGNMNQTAAWPEGR